MILSGLKPRCWLDIPPHTHLKTFLVMGENLFSSLVPVLRGSLQFLASVHFFHLKASISGCYLDNALFCSLLSPLPF